MLKFGVNPFHYKNENLKLHYINPNLKCILLSQDRTKDLSLKVSSEELLEIDILIRSPIQVLTQAAVSYLI